MNNIIEAVNSLATDTIEAKKLIDEEERMFDEREKKDQ